jgi:hypothetical protein
MERVKGIEPSSQAWEAHILPLNHTRSSDPAIFGQADHVDKFYSGRVLLSTFGGAVFPGQSQSKPASLN